MSAATEPGAVLERYLEVHAAADLEAVLALFAEDAVVEDPVGSPVHAGREAIRQFYARTHRTNGRLRLERVGPALVCGREVAAHVRAAVPGQESAPEVDVIYTLNIDSAGRIATLRAFFELG
jgi:steroid delta-isomerase